MQSYKPKRLIVCISKVAAEVLKNLCELNGIEWVIAIPHNIIGPRQKYDDPFRNVVSIMINRMLQGKLNYLEMEIKQMFSYKMTVRIAIPMLDQKI